MDDLDALVDAIEAGVRKGKTPEKAAVDLSAFVPRDVLDAALEAYRDRAEQDSTPEDPARLLQ